MQIIVLKGFKEDLSTILYDAQSFVLEADPGSTSNVDSFLHRFNENINSGWWVTDMSRDHEEYMIGLLPCSLVSASQSDSAMRPVASVRLFALHTAHNFVLLQLLPLFGVFPVSLRTCRKPRSRTRH